MLNLKHLVRILKYTMSLCRVLNVCTTTEPDQTGGQHAFKPGQYTEASPLQSWGNNLQLPDLCVIFEGSRPVQASGQTFVPSTSDTQQEALVKMRTAMAGIILHSGRWSPFHWARPAKEAQSKQ
jgi:hypothetical protein